MEMQTQLILASLACALSGADRAGAPPPSAASYVQAVDLEELQRRERLLPHDERERIKLYMEAAKRDVLKVTDGCFPDKGVGQHWRNLAERAKGAAVLSSFRDYWPEELRVRCRRKAAQWVREIAQEHGRRPNFQYEWQAAFWAAEAGIAAWFLWDELDQELQEAAAQMAAYQADRFIGLRPKMEHRGNTEAETVSWNSAICTLAANMMPDHPRRAAWETAAKTHLYNTFAAPQDARDERIGDDGKPVKDWIVGANIYEDFGLENHGQFHIDYIFACYRFHIQGAALYWLTGKPLPRAFRHHARDMYERVMLRCLDNEKFFVYVSDNDWRRYHNWTESCVLHAYLGLMEQHPLAYALEGQALAAAVRYWRSLPEGFHYDNQYVCGKAWTSRIADAVLLHVTCPYARPWPLAAEDVESELRGTSELKSAQLQTHYDAAGAFRSYGRGKGPAWVRFVAPPAESWMLLPLGLNYGGAANGKPLLQGGTLRSSRGEDWFWVVRHDEDGDAAEAFISLPDGFVVFIERIAAASLGDAPLIENAIAVEKPHCRFAMHFEGAVAEYEPSRNTWRWSDRVARTAAPGRWVNLQSRIGFVCRLFGEDSDPQILLPQPGERSAVRFQRSVQPGRDHRLCMVVCSNGDCALTRKTAFELVLFEQNGMMICRFDRYIVAVNFGEAPGDVAWPGGVASEDLESWSVAARRCGDRLF